MELEQQSKVCLKEPGSHFYQKHVILKWQQEESRKSAAV
jgi:hypothetical protein